MRTSLKLPIFMACVLAGGVFSAFSQAQRAWVARFNGFTNAYGPDIARAVSVDDTGSVYVVGSTTHPETSQTGIALVNYDALGNALWVVHHKPEFENATPVSVRLDALGQPCVAGTSAGDFVLMKYTAAGQMLWQTNYSGTGNSRVTAVAHTTDNAGNSYLTGYWKNPFNGPDYGVTIKYDPYGQQVWVAEYHGTNGLTFRPAAIAVDVFSNCVVTGAISPSFASRDKDIATVKYDQHGAEVWRATYDGAAHAADQPAAVSVDIAGNVYVAGSSLDRTNNNPNSAYVTLKYDPAGGFQWASEYNVDGASQSSATALAIAGDGSVFVTGSSWRISPDFATIKYRPDGNQEWVARFDGPRGGTDNASTLAVDSDGSIYVAGYSWTNGFNDYVVVKYSASGGESWVAYFDGPVHENDQPVAIAVDDHGGVYVTGNSKGTPHFNSTDWADFATIKYVQPAQLFHPKLRSPRNVEVFVKCQYSTDYTVQISEDLVNWTNHVILTNAFGVSSFIDSQPDEQLRRFYRITAP